MGRKKLNLSEEERILRRKEQIKKAKEKFTQQGKHLVKNLTPEQIERKRNRDRIAKLTAEQIERKRNRERIANLTAEQVEKKRHKNRIANLTVEQIERKRNKDRIANLTDEQVEKKRNKNRIANLTVEQVEKKRNKDRIANMTVEQVEKKRNRNRIGNFTVQQIESKGNNDQTALYHDYTPLTRRELYNVWSIEKQGTKMVNDVINHFFITTGLGSSQTEQYCEKIKKSLKNFIYTLKGKWFRASRNKRTFESTNKVWLDGYFHLPSEEVATQPSTSHFGRPQMEFSGKETPKGNLCRLCVNFVEDYKCIYDESAHENEAYQLMMKYFDSAFLNMDNCGDYLSVMCLECWQQISDFYNFQQSVYQAQLRLNNSEQKPDMMSYDNESAAFQNLNDTSHGVCVKLENNPIEDISCQDFSENTLCNPITPKTEELPSKTSQDVNDISIKTEINVSSEESQEPEGVTESFIAAPKIEIMDVYSEDDEAFSCDEFENEADFSCNENTLLNSQSISSAPPKDALSKKNFIKESDEFIKQWNPNLACYSCQETCSTYSQLRQHFLEQHPSEKCYIVCCQRKFYQRYVIEDHVRYHIDPNAFKCEQCNKPHTTRRQLADHVRHHHHSKTSSNDAKYIPKRRVRTDEEMDELIAQWKPNNSLECAVCKEKYDKLKLLQAHFRQIHPDTQFYIECCYRKLKKRYDIEDHARNHINPTSFKCAHCSCPFSTQSNLMRHLRSQHSQFDKEEEVKPSQNKKRITDKELEELVARWMPNLVCVVCNMNCSTLKMLQMHFRTRHPLKQFYLECCNRKFKRRYDIEFHARSHVDPIDFMCKICNNCFSTQSNLMRHMRIYHSNSNANNLNADEDSRSSSEHDDAETVIP